MGGGGGRGPILTSWGRRKSRENGNRGLNASSPALTMETKKKKKKKTPAIEPKRKLQKAEGDMTMWAVMIEQNVRGGRAGNDWITIEPRRISRPP